MPNVVVVGMQWGDEGKGKIVDLLCPAFDAVVRYQGGHNAGHTVRFGERHFSLHLIPSGILHPGMLCLLGNGMVLAPEAFFAEVDGLAGAGIDAAGRLFVAGRAQVLLPPHVALDLGREQALAAGKIGTTGRGIGPAYEIKAARLGVRACDLLAGDLADRLQAQARRIEAELGALGGAGLEPLGALADACRAWGERLAPFLCDGARRVAAWMEEGKSVLFEGAQGALLDVDHGTYPYVTSSSAIAGGACTGAGVPPTRIDGTLGVLKAYSTRVGGGPFPTELGGEVGEFLRQRGNEFGTTTGRPRRCGWLDLAAARYSRLLNGADALALTKLDVLDTLAEIEICVGYAYRGAALRDFPAELEVLERATPVYRTLPGWQRETVGRLELADLPVRARDYIAFIEDELEAPASLVSTGPRREETIVRQDETLARLTAGRLGAVLDQRRPA
jgi:adenylosuccinate synthase